MVDISSKGGADTIVDLTRVGEIDVTVDADHLCRRPADRDPSAPMASLDSPDSLQGSSMSPPRTIGATPASARCARVCLIVRVDGQRVDDRADDRQTTSAAAIERWTPAPVVADRDVDDIVDSLGFHGERSVDHRGGVRCRHSMRAHPRRARCRASPPRPRPGSRANVASGRESAPDGCSPPATECRACGPSIA